jgi:inward rectifier potassium channel
MTEEESKRAGYPPNMAVRNGAFEVTRLGARKFDWRDPYHMALAMSWPRFICLLIVLDLALNVVFASIYFVRPGCIANAHPGSFADSFFFSLETLATVGYGVMSPATLYGHIVASVEILSGMAFMAIMTGLVFVRFSRPHARILYADHPVISRFNGRPTLMIRIANGRAHGLTDATARLSVLVNEWTLEGQFFRRITSLALTRSRIPLFGLTWTLMHEIDAASPLYGRDATKIEAMIARVFLSVEARDPALATRVYDIKDYSPADILFGHRYVDAVAIDQEGRTIANLTRISLTEPEEGALEPKPSSFETQALPDQDEGTVSWEKPQAPSS